MKKITIAFLILGLTGCAISMQARMMPRDSGTVYVGKIVADGINTATMDITIDGERYTGLWVKATTNDSYGLVQQYGSRTGTSAAVVSTGGGTRINKGIFSSANGRGLRCESTATGMGGAGICVDDKSRIFDITVN